MDPGLSDGDVDRLVEGARRKRRRRLVGRIGLGVLLVGAGILAGLRATSPGPIFEPITTIPQAGPASLRLSDGSIATPLDAASALAVHEDSPGRVALALDRGRARFEVAPRPERPFEVQVGEVRVTVVGTVFSVERVADRIGVSVERGIVRVDWQVGEQVLHAGESGWFPPVQIRAPLAESRPQALGADSAPAQVDPKHRGPEVFERAAVTPQPGQNLPERRREDFRQGLLEPPAASHAHAWQPNLAARDEGRGVAAPAPTAKDRLAGVGDERRGQAVPAPSAADLLAAADVDRSAGRRGESVALLRRLLHEHRDDVRAPLAAFTLGRILLMELAQPGEAASAFAQARALAPAGPFAEDALAREAEAWNKAGDAGKATARAREYLRLYPHGRRAGFLQGLIGSE